MISALDLRISRIQRSCLATTLVAWLRTTQRRHRAGPAAEKLTALARQGRARRVLRDWLLATARQVGHGKALGCFGTSSLCNQPSMCALIVADGSNRPTAIT
jgi:hypothetical protein